MKKHLLISLLIFVSIQFSFAQILCVQCFNQNDSIAGAVNNLIVNGGFENTTCLSNQYSSSFCPVSQYYSCALPNWICTGGGTSTYISIDDNTFTVVADGTKALYFGNGSQASACSSVYNDTSCLSVSNCTVNNIPAGYPTNDVLYGGSTGVSVSQTVSGLTVGNTYVLEFWAGGEPQTNGWTKNGVFGVDIGFGYTYLRCKPTQPGLIGTRFLIEFVATSSSHTVKFTNWGHICIPCTELILDNVRLYPLAELPPTVQSCLPTKVAELSENNISIYPNPASNILSIETNQTILWSDLSSVKIVDVLGQIVFQSELANQKLVINIANLKNGIYFIEVKIGTEVTRKKFIKE